MVPRGGTAPMCDYNALRWLTGAIAVYDYQGVFDAVANPRSRNPATVETAHGVSAIDQLGGPVDCVNTRSPGFKQGGADYERSR
jgi:hypothetical protein